jgi:RHS repeat-associated protein
MSTLLVRVRNRTLLTRVLLIPLVLLLLGLPTLPATAGDDAELDGNDGIEMAPPEPPAPPLPDGVRDPVPAETDVDASKIPPTDLVKPTETVQEVVEEEAVLEKQEGGENFDAYSTDDGGTHFAVVYPEQVNYEAPNGDWNDLSPQLAESVDGWTASPDDAVVTFPSTLASDAPVQISLTEGSFSAVPTGITSTKGELTDDSVAYDSAAPSTLYRYTLTDSGYKEEIVWKNEEAAADLGWDLTTKGLTLEPSEFGEIGILAGGVQIGELPAPIVRDSSAELEETAAIYSLKDLGDGSYHLAATVDPEFLKTATYPITIDPTPQHDDRPADRDLYVSHANAGTDFEADPLLRIRGTSGSERNSYLRFGIDAIQKDDRLVYDAELSLYAKQVNNAGDVRARRVTGDWNPNITWNNKPSVGMEIDAQQEQYCPTQENCTPWRLWKLENLYQHYIRTGYSGHWDDKGVELEADSASIDFHSKEQTQFAGDSADPRLFLTWNDLPANPSNLLGPGSTVESPSPKLAIADLPNDQNGDKVYVRFQVDTDPTFPQGSIDFTSPWQKQEKSYVVPSGALTDGQTYYWRAQAKDAFHLTDGSGVTRAIPTSQDVKSFTVSLRHFGKDQRWAMWSRQIGNDISMNVNESNGNLFLEVPLDSVSTPADDLDIGLIFNSLQRDMNAESGTDYGLGPGWDLAIGPHSAGPSMPIELEKIPPQPDGGVKIRMRGGGTMYFPHRDGRVYASIGAGGGEVRRDNSGKFTYRDEQGGRFFFDSNGRLTDAAPVWTNSQATMFSYAYLPVGPNNVNRLKSVTDALGREVLLNWSDQAVPRLDSIRSSAVNWDDRRWTFHFSGNRLSSIDTPVTSTGPDPDAISFGYNTTTGRLLQVRDGEQSVAGVGWQIRYWQDPKSAFRVDTISPPDITPPATDAATQVTTPAGPYWNFDYPAAAPTGSPPNYRGTTSKWTQITDPRGSASGTAYDYLTQVDFNWAGLPLRIQAPSDQNGDRPTTLTVWDGNNNLLCKRSPAANAVTMGPLPDPDLPPDSGTEQPCLAEPLNTTYEYEDQEPYRMTKTTRPAPDMAHQTDRQVEQYRYDEAFEGLWAELYGNQHMTNFPVGERMWTGLDHQWNGDEAPSPIGGGSDWSFRLSGYLDLTDYTEPKDYEFKIFSDDGVTVTIGDKAIVNCFGENQSYNEVNCDGREVVEKTLTPGLKPITIEFSELGGDAKLTVKWDKGDDVDENFTVLPDNRLEPNLGILTSKTAAISSTKTRKVAYDYSTNDSKARELPISETVSQVESGGPTPRTTSFEYNNYGQTTKVTTPVNITENHYVNGVSPSSWIVHDVKVSCMDWTKIEKLDGTVLSQTDTQCDQAGSTTKQVVRVPAVTDPDNGQPIQPAADRTTTTAYDKLGRPLTVDRAGTTGTDLSFSYDRAGRKVSETRLLSSTASAVTEYEYDPRGRLKKERLPDPDGGGVKPRPFVDYTYDAADNLATESDPRNAETGQSWKTTNTYDALNRVVTVEGPDPDGGGSLHGLITSTNHRLLTPSGAYANKTTVTSPANVDTVTKLDVLGRETSKQLGGLNPETFGYDLAGNTTSSSSPDPDLIPGGTNGPLPKVRTDIVYDVFGQVISTTQFAQSTNPATTTNTYDDGGRLKQVDGPLPNAQKDDRIDYDYDAAGRLTRVTQSGIKIPGTGTPGTSVYTEIGYDQAGDRVWMKTPLDNSTTYKRTWSYDELGRMKTSADARGMTQYFYDDGDRLTQVDDPRYMEDLYFTYDRAGHQLSRRRGDPDNTGTGAIDKETFDYDAIGNQVAATNVASGVTVDMAYDHNDRLEQVTGRYLNPGVTSYQTNYEFDAENGQLTSVDDPAGTTWFGYSSDGLISTVDDPIADNDHASGLTHMGGVAYTYDQAGRPVTRTDASSGLSWSRGYEADTGRIDSQTVKKGTVTRLSTDLDYNAAGNVTSRSQTVAGGDDSWTYDYDGAGRMIQAQEIGGATYTYGYDGAGNRTKVQKNSQQAAITSYDQSSLPLQRTDASGTTTYTTDEAGSMRRIDGPSSGEDWVFDYDTWSRMTRERRGDIDAGTGAIGSPTVDVSFKFDGLSRTIKRTSGSDAVNYLYRGTSEDYVKAIATGASPSTVSFTYTPGGPLAQQQGSSRRQYLRDLHGDVVGMVDTSTGGVVGSTTYTPWGDVRTHPNEQSSLGFQGDPTDEASGLVDMLSRHYLPSAGRFTTRDSLFGDPQDPITMNQFTYGEAAPVTFTDVTGMGPSCYYENTVYFCPGAWGQGGGTGYRQVVRGSTESYPGGSSTVGAPAAPAVAVSAPQPKYQTANQKFWAVIHNPSIASTLFKSEAEWQELVDAQMTPWDVGTYEALDRRRTILEGRRAALRTLYADMTDKPWSGCGVALVKCVDVTLQTSFGGRIGVHFGEGIHLGWGKGTPYYGVSFSKPLRGEPIVTGGGTFGARFMEFGYTTGIDINGQRTYRGTTWSFGWSSRQVTYALYVDGWIRPF